MSTDVQPTRHLAWDACHNVRDLGGYPTADGGTTRWRAVLRADSLCRLTPNGQAALVAYGVRTIIDLRNPSEQAGAAHPFALPSEVPDWPVYLSLPMLDEDDAEGVAALDACETVADDYRYGLDRYPARIAAILRALARAPEGTVLIHCAAGKDRTGIVSALVLALAGVPYNIIAADYVATNERLRALYERELANGPDDPAERARLAEWQTCRPETMLAVLSHLEQRYGGVEAYVRAAGVETEDIERLRARLRA